MDYFVSYMDQTEATAKPPNSTTSGMQTKKQKQKNIHINIYIYIYINTQNGKKRRKRLKNDV